MYAHLFPLSNLSDSSVRNNRRKGNKTVHEKTRIGGRIRRRRVYEGTDADPSSVAFEKTATRERDKFLKDVSVF